MTIEWRPVPGYEGLYEVSSAGQVRIVPRYDSNGRWRHGGLRKLSRDKDGYQRVQLRKNSRYSYRHVSHLVLEAFVGPQPSGAICCHGPRGNADDCLDNVEWGTHQKNQGPDRIRDGTRSSCGRKPLLDPGRVAYAHQLHDAGLNTRQIADQLSCSQTVAWKVLNAISPYSTGGQ